MASRTAFIALPIFTAFLLGITGCGGGGGSATTAAEQGLGTNHSPTISGQPTASATVGSAYAFQPSGSDSDGNTLTYSATNLPSWATINAQTGLVSGTPASGDVGTDANIKISVSDGTASASLATFSISVTAQAVVATGRATLSWTPPTTNSDGSPVSLSGYRVVYGTSSSNLSQSVSITDPTAATYTISNLATGTWFFGVKATDTAQNESDVSNVASKTI